METNLKNFLEYIKGLEINPSKEFLLASKFKGKDDQFHYTKWIDFLNWENIYPKINPNYRQVLSNEIVLEKDYESPEQNKQDALKIIQKLKEQNIKFWCIFTGSKSYHIHILCNELNGIENELKPLAKKKIAKDLVGEELYKGIDEANFGNKRLIQIEIATNPKTLKKAEVLDQLIIGREPFLPGITLEERKIVLKKKVIPQGDWKRNLVPLKCPALELFFEKKIKESSCGKTRHEWIAPSMAAYIRFKKNRDELAKKYYIIQDKLIGELESWDSLQTYFSCHRVRQFMQDNNQGSICAKCLMESDN